MDSLKLAIIIIPPLFLAMVLHEIAHALVAYKLGDPTAKKLNRINLNPLVHIDLVWTILVPAMLIFSGSPFVFGAAKPVPVDPRYFKNPRKDMAIVAIAGPITNFILAGISFGLFKLFILLTPLVESTFPEIPKLLLNWCAYSVLINIILGVFNLIPIPPLDGGRILVGILPLRYAIKVAKLERYGFLIVILLIILKIPQMVFSPIIEFIQGLL